MMTLFFTVVISKVKGAAGKKKDDIRGEEGGLKSVIS